MGLNREGGPLHASQAVADVLRQAITAETLTEGQRLPSYRQLAEAHDVAINTAQAAVRALADEGLVEIRPGSGAYVRRRTPTDESVIRRQLEDVRRQVAESQAQLRSAEESLNDLLGRMSNP